MRRLTRPLVVLLALLVGAAPLVDCVTDEPMSASQMACCAAMDHDCGAAAQNKDCCPPTDRSGNQQLVTSASVQIHPAALIAPGPAAWVAPVTSASALFAASQAFDREILKLPERPTYLLVSSFLI